MFIVVVVLVLTVNSMYNQRWYCFWKNEEKNDNMTKSVGLGLNEGICHDFANEFLRD